MSAFDWEAFEDALFEAYFAPIPALEDASELSVVVLHGLGRVRSGGYL